MTAVLAARAGENDEWLLQYIPYRTCRLLKVYMLK